MRQPGVIQQAYCLILGYSPKLKQLIVKSPEQENLVWVIQNLDCGYEPIPADRACIQLHALTEAMKTGVLKLTEPAHPSSVAMPVATECIKLSPQDCIISGYRHLRVLRPDLLGRSVLMGCEGLDPTKNMILVGDTLYNYEVAQAISAAAADYGLDALIHFVQDVNDKYASRHQCASLRIKGPKFIQMFFDDICVLKSGENIADVGYEEVSRRIAHVAECT